MKHREELIQHTKKLLSYEMQLKKQLAEEFGEEIYASRSLNNREKRINYLERCISEMDMLCNSLKALAELAQGDTGGSRVAGQFLLNLYNSKYVNFSLRDLNSLDHGYWQDAMNVLELDGLNYMELHEYLEDGEDILHQMIDDWGNQ